MSFPKEVYDTLSSNSEMKRFLHIVKDSNENSYDYMVPIGKLTSYYNLTLLQKVKPTNYTPNCESLPKNNLLIYHKLKFIEYLIYKKRLKHRKKMIDFANSVLEFLMKWKKSDDGMIIHVNEEELKTYLVADPISVVILLNKFNFYVSLINPILNSLSIKENVQIELTYVIEDISKSLIKRTSFFPIHRLQEKFDTLFLSPLLPFKEKIDEFIKDFPPHDSQVYLQEVFSFVLSIFNVIKINQKPYDSTLVLLIIRLLFDKIYERNVYLTTEGKDILHELSHITVKELTPPPDFSPHYSSDDVQIVQLFRNDKFFSKAVSELENIVFYTNPFDLLNCVDASLSIIEKSATEYNNYQTMVFPFEVTFELFMAVVISSQIPNWENISKLVNTYTPNVGLCPSFEFSKAKMAASVMQFTNMIDDMNGNHVNENAEKASDYLLNIAKNIENKDDEANNSFSNFIENKHDTENDENNTIMKNNEYEISNNEKEEIFNDQISMEDSSPNLCKNKDESQYEESLINNNSQDEINTINDASNQIEQKNDENVEVNNSTENQDESKNSDVHDTINDNSTEILANDTTNISENTSNNIANEIAEENITDNQNNEEITDNITNNQNNEDIKDNSTNNQNNEEIKDNITNNQNNEDIKDNSTNNLNNEEIKDNITDNQNNEEITDNITNNQNNEEITENITKENKVETTNNESPEIIANNELSTQIITNGDETEKITNEETDENTENKATTSNTKNELDEKNSLNESENKNEENEPITEQLTNENSNEETNKEEQ